MEPRHRRDAAAPMKAVAGAMKAYTSFRRHRHSSRHGLFRPGIRAKTPNTIPRVTKIHGVYLAAVALATILGFLGCDIEIDSHNAIRPPFTDKKEFSSIPRPKTYTDSAFACSHETCFSHSMQLAEPAPRTPGTNLPRTPDPKRCPARVRAITSWSAVNHPLGSIPPISRFSCFLSIAC